MRLCCETGTPEQMMIEGRVEVENKLIAFQIPFLPIGVFMFIGTGQEFLKRAEGDEVLQRFAAHIRLGNDALADEAVRGVTYTDRACSLIHMSRLDPKDIKCLSTLWHEALHVAIVHLRRLNVEIGECGEILAYLQEFIANSLLEAYQKEKEHEQERRASR